MKLNMDNSNLGINPMVKWMLCFFIMATFFLIIGYPHFATAIKTDDSGITWTILFLLFLGLIGTSFQAYQLKEDYKFIKYHLQNFFKPSDQKKSFPRGFENKPLVKLLGKCKTTLAHDMSFDSSSVVQSYFTRQNSGNRLLSSLATLLVTLGLIGTIVGLIYAVSGLNEVIHNVGASKDDLMAGLGKTIRGMGTAFYTTFLGALSGGIMLKVLSLNNTVSLSVLSTCLRDFFELDLLPYIAYQKSHGETPAQLNLNDTFSELKAKLEERMKKNLEVLKLQFEHYHESMDTIESDLLKFQTLFQGMKSQDWDTRLTQFSQGLNQLQNSPKATTDSKPLSPKKTIRPASKKNES